VYRRLIHETAGEVLISYETCQMIIIQDEISPGKICSVDHNSAVS
jgi:hypothetical protein